MAAELGTSTVSGNAKEEKNEESQNWEEAIADIYVDHSVIYCDSVYCDHGTEPEFG